jgi:hypothetical protein
MGCNGSKREDVDRERRPVRPASSSPSTTGSSTLSGDQKSQPISASSEVPRTANRAIHSVGSPKMLSGSVDGVYGTSFTNRKTQEYDLLHEIVQSTRSNFIDVSAKTDQLDDEDIQERSQKYQKQLFNGPNNSNNAAVTGSLAAPSAPLFHSILLSPVGCDSSALSDALSLLIPLPASDIEFITNYSQSIAEAIGKSRIIERGKLVKTFEEL